MVSQWQRHVTERQPSRFQYYIHIRYITAPLLAFLLAFFPLIPRHTLLHVASALLPRYLPFSHPLISHYPASVSARLRLRHVSLFATTFRNLQCVHIGNLSWNSDAFVRAFTTPVAARYDAPQRAGLATHNRSTSDTLSLPPHRSHPPTSPSSPSLRTLFHPPASPLIFHYFSTLRTTLPPLRHTQLGCSPPHLTTT